MIDPIGARAIQSIGIDVANLTSRLAVNTSILEEIITQASEIDTSVFVQGPETTNETGHPTGYTVTMDAHTAEKVSALLAFIRSLQ
jgi:hypothetical protein